MLLIGLAALEDTLKNVSMNVRTVAKHMRLVTHLRAIPRAGAASENDEDAGRLELGC